MIVVLLAIYLRQRHKRKRYITIPDDDTLIPPQDVAIDPNEIKIHERIGRGSFGDIYRYPTSTKHNSSVSLTISVV